METMELLTVTEGKIAWAKTLTESLTEPLNGKVVTAGTNQFSGYIYIEEPDRSCGIRVETTGSFRVGDVVDVTSGTIDESDGELYIVSATVAKTGAPANFLKPVFMIQRSLGGGAAGRQQAVKDGHGLSNVGLLVTAVGKITAAGSDYFYIDDGSAMDDGLNDPQVLGVRVETDHLITPFPIPPAGAYVVVTGISSCKLDDSHSLPIRVLRPRSYGDITAGIVIHVRTYDDGGRDTNDGLSWGTAVETVHHGIELAHNAVMGEVWVAEGTYVDHVNLPSYVALYGGFQGIETYREQRDWIANETILDGGYREPSWLQGSVVSIGDDDPIAEVVGCRVDGFTIQNGGGGTHYITRPVSNLETSCGGGIYCYGGSFITIANNTVKANYTAFGGGICCTASSPEIRNNIFQSNAAGAPGEGGAMFCNDGSCPLISGNRFVGNDGGGHGGAIALESFLQQGMTKPLVTNNIFRANHVGWEDIGGGAISARDSVPTIINNTFVDNHAYNSYGGAITLVTTSGVRVYNNIFYNNTAAYGQSVYAHEGCGDQDIEFCDAWNEAGQNNGVTHYTTPGQSGYEMIGGTNEAGGCLYADPRLVYIDLNLEDGDDSDYHLRHETGNVSPCIDKGVDPGNTTCPGAPSTDMDGHHRPVDILDVSNGTGGCTDMGSYEVQQ